MHIVTPRCVVVSKMACFFIVRYTTGKAGLDVESASKASMKP